MNQADSHGAAGVPPEVSVVIPTHNRPRYLARSVACVAAQIGVEVEIVVSDDGSEPGNAAQNAEIVEGFETARLVVEKHATGVAAARNRGAAAASGTWLAFLDDDDLWSPAKLSRQIEAASALDRSWGFSGSVWIDPDLEVLGVSRPPPASSVETTLLRRNVVPAGSSNVFMRRVEFERLGGFDRGLHHMADWDLWIRLLELGAPAMIDEPDVGYLRHDSNMSLDPEGVQGEMLRIEERHRHRLVGGKVDRAFVYRWIAWHRLARGDRRGAMKLYRDCVREGDRSSVARWFAALLGISRRPDPGSSDAWGARAEPWLAALRAGDRD